MTEMCLLSSQLYFAVCDLENQTVVLAERNIGLHILLLKQQASDQ